MHKSKKKYTKPEVFREFLSPLVLNIMDLIDGWELERDEIEAIKTVDRNDELFLVYSFWKDNYKNFNLTSANISELDKIALDMTNSSDDPMTAYNVILLDNKGKKYKLQPQVEYVDFTLVQINES
jgi:hypothetical protein